MDEFYEHPATITKTELGETVEHRYTLNRAPVVVGGKPWDHGELVFIGFAGNHIGGQRYKGHYRFRLAQPRDSEKDFFDVSSLPDGPPTVAPAPLTDEDVDNASTLDPKARTSTEPVVVEEADDGVHAHSE